MMMCCNNGKYEAIVGPKLSGQPGGYIMKVFLSVPLNSTLHIKAVCLPLYTSHVTVRSIIDISIKNLSWERNTDVVN